MEIYEKNSSIPYNRFLLLLKKRSFAGNCENQIEKMLYGVTHQEYGAGIIFNSELFKPIEKAILYHQEPYLMKETYPDLHFLTQLIQVSSNLAKNIQKIEKLNDEVLSSWVFEETGEFKVNANILMTAMNTVNNDLL